MYGEILWVSCISWEVASVLVFGRNMQKVMRLYKRRYIICTSCTFINDAIWYAIRVYIVTTHIFGILTSKLCILNVMTRTHLLTVHLKLISTCLGHFFSSQIVTWHHFGKKHTFYSKFSSPLTSSMFFNLESSWFCPSSFEAGEVRRSDSARGTTEVGSARVRGEVRRHLGQVLPCLKIFGWQNGSAAETPW